MRQSNVTAELNAGCHFLNHLRLRTPPNIVPVNAWTTVHGNVKIAVSIIQPLMLVLISLFFFSRRFLYLLGIPGACKRHL
jgi:hypothetical protein